MSDIYKCSKCGKVGMIDSDSGFYPRGLSGRFHRMRGRLGNQDITLPDNTTRGKYYKCPYCSAITVFPIVNAETVSHNITVNDAAVENAEFSAKSAGNYVIKRDGETILTFKITN